MLNTLMENENTSFVNISIPFLRSCSGMHKLFYKPYSVYRKDEYYYPKVFLEKFDFNYDIEYSDK